MIFRNYKMPLECRFGWNKNFFRVNCNAGTILFETFTVQIWGYRGFPLENQKESVVKSSILLMN